MEKIENPLRVKWSAHLRWPLAKAPLFDAYGRHTGAPSVDLRGKQETPGLEQSWGVEMVPAKKNGELGWGYVAFRVGMLG